MTTEAATTAQTGEGSLIAIEETGTTGSAPDPSEDPAFGYRYVRYSIDEAEQQRYAHRSVTTFDHASPDSVLIVPIANHWSPGSWQAVLDMAHTYKQSGADVAVQEIMDRCFAPYDSLGSMRNEAIMKAMEGWDWLVMVDNDVYPEPDALLRLVSRGMPFIAPYVVEPGTGKPLHGPHRQRWTGLQPVRWCVLSMMVIRTNVFNCTGPEFWSNAIGADEGYHFQKLWHYGHSPVIDTEVSVRVGNAPTYPLASLRMDKNDYDEFWNRRRKHLLSRPDRSPINPNDGRVNEHGDYLPFIDPNAADQSGSQAMVTGPDGRKVPVAPKQAAPVAQGAPDGEPAAETPAPQPAKPNMMDPARLAGLAKLATGGGNSDGS